MCVCVCVRVLLPRTPFRAAEATVHRVLFSPSPGASGVSYSNVKWIFPPTHRTFKSSHLRGKPLLDPALPDLSSVSSTFFSRETKKKTGNK